MDEIQTLQLEVIVATKGQAGGGRRMERNELLEGNERCMHWNVDSTKAGLFVYFLVIGSMSLAPGTIPGTE